MIKVEGATVEIGVTEVELKKAIDALEPESLDSFMDLFEEHKDMATELMRTSILRADFKCIVDSLCEVIGVQRMQDLCLEEFKRISKMKTEDDK